MEPVRRSDSGACRDAAQGNAVESRAGDRTRGCRGEAGRLLRRHPGGLSHRSGVGGGTSFASALLIERASPLTHVAVIARELGVPTVVQIDGLTSAIRTGMTVSVDGARGRITLLEDEPDQARSDA